MELKIQRCIPNAPVGANKICQNRLTFAQQSLFVFLALMTMVMAMMERKKTTEMLPNTRYPLTLADLKYENLGMLQFHVVFI